jgi:hypothetical protein
MSLELMLHGARPARFSPAGPVKRLAGLLAAATMFALLGCGGAPATKVGAPVTVREPVAIDALAAAPATFAGQTVRLEGTVKSVCQGSGCWVEVEDKKGATFLAKSLDHSILLPTDCEGKRVVVQGVVTEMKPEDAEHQESGDGSCPSPTYVVVTQGAVVK